MSFFKSPTHCYPVTRQQLWALLLQVSGSGSRSVEEEEEEEVSQNEGEGMMAKLT